VRKTGSSRICCARSQLEDAQLAEDEQKMIEQVLAEIQKSQNRGHDGDA
jgi:hypothetical protein